MAFNLPDLVAKLRIDTTDLRRVAGEASRSMQNVSREASNALGDLPDDMGRVGSEAGQRLGEGFEREATVGVDAAGRRIATNAERIGREAGDGMSRGIVVGMLPGLDITQRRLGELGRSLAILGLITSFAVLGQQAIALAGALVPVAGIIATLPTLLGAAGAGIGTLFAGLRNVGAAFKQTGKAAGGAAADTTAMKRAVENAAKGIKRANEGVEDAMRGVAAAHERVADAVRDLERVQRRALAAQQALNRAREDAIRRLSEYQSKLEDAAADEEAANIAQLEARRELETLIRANVTDEISLRKARHAIIEAELRYKKAVQDNLDLQKESIEAQRKGVEGDEKVIDARERVADANHSIEDAQKAVARANEGVADANRSLVRAQEEVIESHQRLADAQAALAKGAGGAAGGVDKAAEALAKLAPNARSFVLAVLAMRSAWDDLTRAVQNQLFEGLDTSIRQLAAASFPTLRTGMVSVAGALNSMARAAMDAGSTPFFQGAMAQVFESTRASLQAFADATRPLTLGLINLAAVGGPFLLQFSQWAAGGLASAGAFLQTAEGADRMRGVIQRAGEALSNLWSIVGNLGSALGGIFQAADSAGYLDRLVAITEQFATWANSAEGQDKLGTLFSVLAQTATHLATALSTLFNVVVAVLGFIDRLPKPVKDVVLGFAAWAIVLGPALMAVSRLVIGIRGLISAAGFIGKVFGPIGKVLAGAFSGFGRLILRIGAPLAKLAPVVVKFGAVVARIGPLIGRGLLMAMGPIGIIIALVATLVYVIVRNWDTIKAATIAVWNAVSGFVVGVWERLRAIVSAVWQGISDRIAGAWNFIKDTTAAVWNFIVAVLVGAWQNLRNNVSAVWNFISGVVVGAWNWIKDSTATVWAFIKKHVGDAWDGIKNAIAAGIRAVVAFVSELPGKVIRTIGNLKDLLFDKGKDLIQGLIDGATSLLSKIGKFFLDKLPSWIREPFKKALNIESPSKEFYGYGAMIVRGLINGIAAMEGKAVGTMGHLAGAVAGGFDVGPLSMGASATGAGRRYGAAPGGGVHYENHVHLPVVPYTAEQVGREAVHQLRNLEHAYL